MPGSMKDLEIRECQDCGLEYCTDPGGCWDDMNEDPTVTREAVVRCECGAESVKSNIHSVWCPKAES